MRKFSTVEAIGAFAAMIDMQYALNFTVAADWDQKGNRWDRAIWLEMGEWMDHVGWKWWKKQKCDIEQARLEAVDIFHFMLSAAIEHGKVPKLLNAVLTNYKGFDGAVLERIAAGDDGAKKYMQASTEYLVHLLTSCEVDDNFSTVDRLHVATVIDHERLAAWVLAQITFEELYLQYVGKNTLNLFRQENGYNRGSYVKVIGGVEDNVALSRALQHCRESGTPVADVKMVVMASLDAWYQGSRVEPA